MPVKTMCRDAICNNMHTVRADKVRGLGIMFCYRLQQQPAALDALTNPLPVHG
jgi:hypothetical protein